MNIRTMLMGSAAAAVLAAASPVASIIDFNPVSSAKAAVSVGFSLFYDDLAPHGDWVNYRDGYVFVPAGVGRDWRPYTEGRWVYTDYGWTWASDEPFGWATYHYGRWAFDDEIGWFWVPGRRWAPAWVSWRHSDDDIAWAPLPPDGHDTDLEFNISFGAVRDDYWVAVPTRSFLSINLSTVLIHDDNERRRFFREARNEDRVRLRKDRLVNMAFDPAFIEKQTGEKVPRREVRRSDRPGQERVTGDSVTVFNEEVRPGRKDKPGKIKEINEVRRSGGTGNTDQTQQPPVKADGPPQDAPPKSTAGKNEKVPTGGAVQGDNQQPAKQQARNRQPPVQADGPPVDAPPKAVNVRRKVKPVQNVGQARQRQEVQKNRRNKPVVVQDGGSQQLGAPRKQRRVKPDQQRMQQGAPAAERRGQAPKKPTPGRRNQKQCDPNVNPDCAVQ